MRQKWLQKPPLGTPINWSHHLAKGLVGFWAFQEGGGDLVNDLSGNANHGTLKNMAFPPIATSGWNAGRKGVGLKFDGTDDYVDCGNDASLNMDNSFSVCLWMKWSDLGRNQFLLSKSGGSKWNFELSLMTIDRFKFIINDGSYNPYIYSSVLSADTWYYLCAVRDTNADRLYTYVNAVRDRSPGTEDTTTGSILTTNNLVIGALTRNSGYKFNGQIDQVRIYNRALSAEEIKQLYLYPYAGFQQPCTAWLYAAAAGGLSIPVAMHNYRRMRT